MDIKKNLQQALFKELARFEIKALNIPEYNGYNIDEAGEYMTRLNTLHENFESELSDNLTSLSPALEIYFTDLLETIGKIKTEIQDQQKEEIYLTLKENPEVFKRERLGYVNHIINYQLNIINKAEEGILQKLEMVKTHISSKPNEKSEDSTTVESVPAFTRNIKSRLSKVRLTTFLWACAEARIFEFDDSHNVFVKFLENNLQYFDDNTNTYCDMKHVGELMSQFNAGEARPEPLKDELIETLKQITLPTKFNTVKSVLQKNKSSKTITQEQRSSVERIKEDLKVAKPTE